MFLLFGDPKLFFHGITEKPSFLNLYF